MSLSLRFAARSDVGLIRDGNEDSGYAGPRLLAVADGLGGQAAGEVASSAVVTTVSTLDQNDPGPELLDALGNKVVEANELLRRMIEEQPQLEGMGTTLTALLWTGAKFGMVHIGDSRAYLLRDGVLQQVSQDHTWVQRLVDEGRITPDEADHHPQRSLLMRAIDGRGQVDLDLSVLTVRIGDRYLLCSDGLSSVVSRDTLQETLSVGGDPDQAAAALIDLARRAGGPDNITCIVADIVDAEHLPPYVPLMVGAASEERHQKAAAGPDSPAARAATMIRQATASEGIPGPFETEGAVAPGPPPPRRRRRFWIIAIVVIAVVLVAGGAGIGYTWSQSRYYVGANAGNIAIFQGVDQSVLGVSLSSLYHDEGIPVSSLPQADQQQVKTTIATGSLPGAQQIVSRLTSDMCQAVQSELPTPTPTTAAPLPTPTAGAPTPAVTTNPTTPIKAVGAGAAALSTPTPGVPLPGTTPTTATPQPTVSTTPSTAPSRTEPNNTVTLPPSVLAACGAG